MSNVDAFIERLAELPLPGTLAPDPERPISDYPRMPRGTCYSASSALSRRSSPSCGSSTAR